jgi:hypothetical protein
VVLSPCVAGSPGGGMPTVSAVGSAAGLFEQRLLVWSVWHFVTPHSHLFPFKIDGNSLSLSWLSFSVPGARPRCCCYCSQALAAVAAAPSITPFNGTVLPAVCSPCSTLWLGLSPYWPCGRCAAVSLAAGKQQPRTSFLGSTAAAIC